MANQRVQSSLARLDKNKEKLLQTLIDGRDRGAGNIIFDTTASWTILRRIAESYLSVQMGKSPPSNALRVKDLNTLKRSLIVAHALLVKENVYLDLAKAIFHARHKQEPKNVLMADPGATDKIIAELDEGLRRVQKLKIAASAAAANARSKPGRPNSGSSILPSYYIVNLAKLYRGATGRVPGAGEGPFGFFLVEFLNAVGSGNLESRSIFNLIIRARKTSLAADANSPFKR
jgi:hypothetical protein